MTEETYPPHATSTDATSFVPAPQLPALADQYGDDRRIDVSRMDEPDRRRVGQIAGAVLRLDGSAVNSYGMAPQSEANKYLDQLMDGIRTADVGSAGAVVAELATGVKMLDIPGMRREAQGRPGGLAGLPLVGKYWSAFRRFKANYEDINKHFARIEDQGRKEMARLAAMDSRMDGLVNQNLRNMKDLEIYVAAGQVVLDREKLRYRDARDKALANRDQKDLMMVRDHGEQINAFESRLLRLHMAMTDGMLSIPQTRLTQSAGRIEYRNIMDTLMFDLPRLKAAILRIAALKGISDAAKGSDARRRLATQLSQAGVEALDSAYVKAKESEAGALGEIAAMGEIADRIMGIVDKGALIDQRNRASREEATRLLLGVKEKFVEGLARSTANAVESARH